jgi:hypothetical protein
MSRVEGAESADPISLFDGFDFEDDQAFLFALKARMTDTSNPLDRRQIGRLLISHALLCPDDLEAETIILMIESLQHVEFVPDNEDIGITLVLDAYQRLYAHSENPPKIPHRLTDAIDTAVRWNTQPLPRHSGRHNV